MSYDVVAFSFGGVIAAAFVLCLFKKKVLLFVCLWVRQWLPNCLPRCLRATVCVPDWLMFVRDWRLHFLTSLCVSSSSTSVSAWVLSASLRPFVPVNGMEMTHTLSGWLWRACVVSFRHSKCFFLALHFTLSIAFVLIGRCQSSTAFQALCAPGRSLYTGKMPMLSDGDKWGPALSMFLGNVHVITCGYQDRRL